MSHAAKMPPAPVRQLRPDVDAAHTAGQRLLAAREARLRKIRRQHRINFYASIATLVFFFLFFTAGIWWLLSEEIGS